MKKLRHLLTLLLLLCSVVVNAHDFMVDGIYYNITDEANKTVEVTFRGKFYDSYSNEYTGSVVIPTSVTYNETIYSVTSIGNYAFNECSGLTSIEIPNSVRSIGGGAFRGCSGLTSITIPNSVTSIGGSAFYECHGLTSITIPNSVTSIGGYAFYYCNGLTSITIPNSVTSIGGCAFFWCFALTSIEIPNSVTSIGDEAFYGCNGLKSVTISKSVTSIGASAFRGCSGLTSITIPNSVTSIGDGAFRGCSGLTSITIPNSVTSIGGYAFGYCDGLTKVLIGKSVTSIGDKAFYECFELKNVNNLSSLSLTKGSTSNGYVAYYAENINICEQEGEFAFDKNTKKMLAYFGNATHVVLPDKYNGASYSIGENAFENCSNILSVTIGTNVDAIDTYAFSGCNNIAKVFWLPNTPPAGYTTLNGKINYVANNKYTNLDSIVVTSNLSSKFEVDGMVFIPTDFANRQCCVVDDLNDNLEDIVVKDTVIYKNVALAVTDVMPYSFYNNDVVKTLTLNIKGSIGASAFEGCRSLGSVNIPQKITSIGDHAFKGCKELTTARIEDRTTVLPLGKRLFDDTALQDLYIGAKISYINEVSQEASPFCENKTLKNVVITDIEDHIYDFEFYDCSALETVTVGDGVESIGNWAFSGCYSLSEFVFGSNVSSIGEEAFSDCTVMTKITGRAVLPPVCGTEALDDINKWDCTLYVPSRNLSQYQNAEQWKHFVNVTELVTTDKYVTYMIDGDLYKTLLLTPGNRIIAPYVAAREDGTPFAGWEMDEYIPSNAGANGIELKLNESMLYTNAPCTTTSYGEQFVSWSVLLDKKNETYFHSEYGGKQTPDGLDHYIRVDVGENMSIGKFTFTYTTRYNNNSVSPKTMVVEGSNSADGIYTEIATLTNLPGDGNTVYTSQELGSDNVRYRYIRYRVTENSGGGLDNGHPFFAMSEFDMQGLLKNEGTVSAIDYPIMPNVDITINGSYTKTTYTLTYMVDDDVYKTFTLKPGAQIPAVENPQKDGFVFSGWSDIPDVMPAENFTITGTFDLEKTGIKDVSEISNNRMYHITQPHYSNGRTSWIVANGGNALQLNSELNVNVQPYDARQQFAIISKDGSTRYLYSVSEKKFVNKDGSLSEKPVDVVLFKSATYTRTFVIYFDNTHYININENQQLVINANGTANANNSCSIVAVDAFNPTEALNRFNGTKPVTGITLNNTRVSLAVGATITLEATVTPADAIDKTVTWTTSNSAVATVENGVVKAVALGSATITATAGDSFITCVITVEDREIPVTGITLDRTTAIIIKGNTVTLVPTLYPDNTTENNVAWSTSDNSVATVENGVVTAVGLGVATITATAGECSTTCLVVVNNHNNGKLYHIATNRASWCVETGGGKLAANTTENKSDACQQFAVLSVDGVAYYLYHPAEKKFINKNGSLSSAPVDAIHFNYIKDSNTYVAYFDNSSYINIDGNKDVLIDGWAHPDDGNCCTFTEVGTFDPTAALRWFGEFVPVSGVTFDRTTATIVAGEGIVLTATVSPADATDQTVEWATSNANVATVDGGVVTTVAPGTAVITATAGGYSATCTVTVTANTVAVSGITLDKATATILEGGNLALNATVSPANATDKTVAWATSDANVATVYNGVVIAVAPGTAVITATIGNFMAYCIVTVEVDDTAVDEVESDAKKEDVIYDMQGYRLIEITKPGIYIINGKKVLVK